MELPGRRSRGRAKRRYVDVVREDMKSAGVREEMEADTFMCDRQKVKSRKEEKKLIITHPLSQCCIRSV